MNILKSIIFISLLVTLAACDRPDPRANKAPEQRAGYYDAELLFVKDGCSVYSFTHIGDVHYFVKCEGSSTTQTFDKQRRMVGKVQTVKTRSITTEMKELEK